MIKYIQGDLLNSEAEALVNTVNTVGVMGKGIALQFKKRFPQNFKIYLDACKKGTFKTGQILITKDGDLMHQKTIINFPTKVHWKGNSQYEYILSGLKSLKEALIEKEIKSVAIPPLGCGNGGLEWEKVKQLIENELSELECEIQVYSPNEEIKKVLQKEKANHNTKLTPARAMLLYLLFHYEAQGEQSSLFVANKLAYFLQRSGENLKLNFQAHHYGPYSVQLNHVLLYLNGLYLKSLEQNVIKPFEPIELNYDKFAEVKQYVEQKLNPEQNKRLNEVIDFIRGYESSFSLELLASVDFLATVQNLKNLEEIKEGISSWNNRKSNIFKPNYIEIAYKHLKNYPKLYFS